MQINLHHEATTTTPVAKYSWDGSLSRQFTHNGFQGDLIYFENELNNWIEGMSMAGYQFGESVDILFFYPLRGGEYRFLVA